MWLRSAKLARHDVRYLSGIRADLMQEPRDRYAHPDEMQAGLRAWNTVLSDRCEMADERLEAGVVAGCRHNGIWGHA